MDRDGKNKRDLTEGSREFAYGFNASPDGRRIAYHKSYKVYIADADGSNAREVVTGLPFNFVPQWSADGKHLLFVAGEHYNCHPHVVRADGTGLRKLADRGGYRGVVEFLDVPDFHGGSSDVPVWSTDGSSVFYTARVGANVELFQATLDGRNEQLTRTPGRLAALSPTTLARRTLAGFRLEARRHPAALRACGFRIGPFAGSPTSNAATLRCGRTGSLRRLLEPAYCRDRAGRALRWPAGGCWRDCDEMAPLKVRTLPDGRTARLAPDRASGIRG